MTAKEWLNRGDEINKNGRAMLEEQAEMSSMIHGIQAVKFEGERVQGGKKRRPDDLIVKYADYEHRLDEEIDRLVDIKKEIFFVIRQVKDNRLRALLIRRYLRFNTWEQIAEHLDVSVRGIHKGMHPRALKEIEKILKGSLEFTIYP